MASWKNATASRPSGPARTASTKGILRPTETVAAAGLARDYPVHAALQPFVAQADWLLDLHSMHEPGLPLSLAGMHPRNLQLARALRAPEYVVVDAGHKDGVRMRDYGRFGMDDATQPGTRSLLIECGFHGDASSLVVARDQCFRFLVAAGAVSAALRDPILMQF